MFYEAMVTNGLLRPDQWLSLKPFVPGKMDRFPRTYHEIIAELEAEIELLKSQQHDDRQLILLLGLLLLANPRSANITSSRLPFSTPGPLR